MTGSLPADDLGYPGARMTDVDDHMAAAGAHLDAERPAEAAAAEAAAAAPIDGLPNPRLKVCF